MKNVLQILPLSWFLRIKKFQKLLDEGRSNVHLKRFDIRAIVDNELEEELIDWLQVRPSGVRQCFFLNRCFVTSSIPIPSPGRPCFFRTGRGLKMFFSIMLITRSK
jgi:hypothetical protein